MSGGRARRSLRRGAGRTCGCARPVTFGHAVHVIPEGSSLRPVNQSTLASATAENKAGDKIFTAKAMFSEEATAEHDPPAHAMKMFNLAQSTMFGSCLEPAQWGEGVGDYQEAAMKVLGDFTTFKPCADEPPVCSKNFALGGAGIRSNKKTWSMSEIMQAINEAYVKAKAKADSLECPTPADRYLCLKTNRAVVTWYVGLVIWVVYPPGRSGVDHFEYVAIAQVSWECSIVSGWDWSGPGFATVTPPDTGGGGTPTPPDTGGDGGRGLASVLDTAGASVQTGLTVPAEGRFETMEPRADPR